MNQNTIFFSVFPRHLKNITGSRALKYSEELFGGRTLAELRGRPTLFPLSLIAH